MQISIDLSWYLALMRSRIAMRDYSYHRRGFKTGRVLTRGDESECFWTNKLIHICSRMDLLDTTRKLDEMFLKVPWRLYQFLHLTWRAQVDADGRTDGCINRFWAQSLTGKYVWEYVYMYIYIYICGRDLSTPFGDGLETFLHHLGFLGPFYNIWWCPRDLSTPVGDAIGTLGPRKTKLCIKVSRASPNGVERSLGPTIPNWGTNVPRVYRSRVRRSLGILKRGTKVSG
jgi:hypothetical protein